MDEIISNNYDKIKELYSSRSLPVESLSFFTQLMDRYSFQPESIFLLVEYVFNLLDKKAKPYDAEIVKIYIVAVAKIWNENKIINSGNINNWLYENQKKTNYYYEIQLALGINRGLSNSEIKMITRWHNEYHFSKDIIDLAIGEISDPTIKNVDDYLRVWFQNDWLDIPTILTKTQKIHKNNHTKHQDVYRLSDEDKIQYDLCAQDDEEWFNSIPYDN